MTNKQTANIGAGKPGPGRPKGAKNRMTRAAKEAFVLAFDGVGGVDALTEWARENPTEFYKLYARLIPAEQRVTGADGGAVQISWPLPRTALDQ